MLRRYWVYGIPLKPSKFHTLECGMTLERIGMQVRKAQVINGLAFQSLWNEF